MVCQRFIEAISLEQQTYADKIGEVLQELESLPGTIHGLFWQYSYDFLYLSQSLEKVLGYPPEKFAKNSMVVFQSLIPPELLQHVYGKINAHVDPVLENPELLFATGPLVIEAALYNNKGVAEPIENYALLLDEKPGNPKSFLIVCTWNLLTSKSQEEIVIQRDHIFYLLQHIRQLYMHSNPRHFSVLRDLGRISDREREVAILLGEGNSTKIISEKLQISFNTVESHRKNLMVKLGVKNTAALVCQLSKYQVLG
jgi:DNA-binding CsgD family transcriptional regulator